eukprot:GHVQ01035012.1.p1 GENE.GHVQ01035012.1~~GHVQ01035012.1.p1  ORF type:complete len:406 (-),score=68.16 GHVQ01035012.1:630-1847(-)
MEAPPKPKPRPPAALSRHTSMLQLRGKPLLHSSSSSSTLNPRRTNNRSLPCPYLAPPGQPQMPHSCVSSTHEKLGGGGRGMRTGGGIHLGESVTAGRSQIVLGINHNRDSNNRRACSSISRISSDKLRTGNSSNGNHHSRAAPKHNTLQRTPTTQQEITRIYTPPGTNSTTYQKNSHTHTNVNNPSHSLPIHIGVRNTQQTHMASTHTSFPSSGRSSRRSLHNQSRVHAHSSSIASPQPARTLLTTSSLKSIPTLTTNPRPAASQERRLRHPSLPSTQQAHRHLSHQLTDTHMHTKHTYEGTMQPAGARRGGGEVRGRDKGRVQVNESHGTMRNTWEAGEEIQPSINRHSVRLTPSRSVPSLPGNSQNRVNTHTLTKHNVHPHTNKHMQRHTQNNTHTHTKHHAH